MAPLRILLLSCLLTLPVSLHAEEEKYHGKYSREHLERGEASFRTMRNWGLIGLGAGALLIITGAVIASNADQGSEVDEYGETVDHTDFGQVVTGVITVVSGFTVTGVGTTFAIIGERNRSKYAGMLEAISLKPELKRERQGVVLSLRFRGGL